MLADSITIVIDFDRAASVFYGALGGMLAVPVLVIVLSTCQVLWQDAKALKEKWSNRRPK